MERVAVLHDELAGPHQAEAGAYLVAELGLDVIEVAGQLAVAPDGGAEQLGDDFLLGRAQAVVAVVAILEAQHLGPHDVPAAAALPRLRRLHHRHEDLLGADAVKLLADDRLDLAQHAQSERQPVVGPRG